MLLLPKFITVFLTSLLLLLDGLLELHRNLCLCLSYLHICIGDLSSMFMLSNFIQISPVSLRPETSILLLLLTSRPGKTARRFSLVMRVLSRVLTLKSGFLVEDVKFFCMVIDYCPILCCLRKSIVRTSGVFIPFCKSSSRKVLVKTRVFGL